MENRFTNNDATAYDLSIVISLGMGLVFLIGSIFIIDNGLAFIGLPLGAIGLASLAYFFDGLRKLLHHRYLMATFKQQTKDLFIFSLGESETDEDDDTVAYRVDFALHYLGLTNNPHCVTVWMLMFRDAFAIGHVTGGSGKVAKVVRVEREGLTVRETREEYNEFCEIFQAEREQEALIEKRGSKTSDEWVNKHWFNQDLQAENFES